MTPIQEQDKTEININDIDGKTLESMIRCFYTGHIDIDEDNVLDLLVAASFLIFPHLERKCISFLVQPEIVNKSNCVAIWAMAKRYTFYDLQVFTFPIVLRNFLTVVKTEDFVLLNRHDLLELLENDDVLSFSEQEIFKALVSWVRYDLNKRKSMFPDLVQVVRIPLLSETVSVT